MTVLLYFFFAVIIGRYMPRKKGEFSKDERETMTMAFKKSRLHKVREVLATLFYLIWIVIGVFFLLVIVGQVKGGALSGILGSQKASTVDTTQAPTETDLPGVGRVNINCVKSALKPESLQKLATTGDSSFLQGDEKTNFEAFLVAKESPSPSPEPK